MTDTIYRGLGAIVLLVAIILAVELYHWLRARQAARRRIQTRLDQVLMRDREDKP